ncbi:MAG: LamG domain-containing protein, partial [Candidatus Woesearchaeota archaeon]
GSGGEHYLFKGDGARGFVSQGIVFDSNDYGGGANYDFDGDGDQDYIVSYEDLANKAATVYINNGTGGFTALDVEKYNPFSASQLYLSYAIAAPEYDEDIDWAQKNLTGTALPVSMDIHAANGSMGEQSLCFQWDSAITIGDCVPYQDTNYTVIANVSTVQSCNITISNAAEVNATVNVTDSCQDGAYYDGAGETETGDVYSAVNCSAKQATAPASGSVNVTFTWNESAAILLTENGWVENGTCSEYDTGKKYWIQNVTLTNTEPINFTNVTWSISTPAGNSSNITSGQVAELNQTPINVTAMISESCSTPPDVSGVILNATDHPLNRTTANLTAWPQGMIDSEGDAVKAYYNWYVNDTSITVLDLLMSQDAFASSSDQQTVYDVSGYGNHARLGGAGVGDAAEPTFAEASGYDGFGAYAFDGVDDYITVGDQPELDMTGDFTLESWVKVQGNGSGTDPSFMIIAGKTLLGGATTLQYEIAARTNRFRFNVNNGTAGTDGLVAASSAYTLNTWYHVVGTREDGILKMYINGNQQVETHNISGDLTNSYPFTIGSRQSFDYNFNGTISDVKVYNKSLTLAQIQSNYYSGIGRYNVTVSDETVKHDRWNVSVTPVDSGGLNGTTVWSNEVIIRNTPPEAPALITPTDMNDTIQTRFPELDWEEAYDADGDVLTYDVAIAGGCGSPIYYNGVTDSNRNVTDELNTYDECPSEWYNWTVTPYDGEGYGETSTIWEFKIMPIIILSLNPDTIDFGEMFLGESANTTEDDPFPFIITNNGTVVADIVNVTANSNLWVSSPSPTDKFQIKVSDNETGSINLTGSATDWIQVSLSNVTLIDSLNYSDANDQARVDLWITVPLDETSGLKSVDLIFYGVQT